MSGSNAQSQQATDRMCADHLPQCPTCGDLCPPGATKCECGERLLPHPAELPQKRIPYGCTCGGNNLCTVCVIAEYEGEL